jgi:hypothetical protein
VPRSEECQFFRLFSRLAVQYKCDSASSCVRDVWRLYYNFCGPCERGELSVEVARAEGKGMVFVVKKLAVYTVTSGAIGGVVSPVGEDMHPPSEGVVSLHAVVCQFFYFFGGLWPLFGLGHRW